MQNQFCKSLSNALSFRIIGDSNTLSFNPCCLYNDFIPYHPTVFKKYRKLWIEADKEYLPGCSKCELKEKTHGVSRTTRLIINNQIPDDIDDQIYKVEVVLDTTCNAACIQCGTQQSSLWRNEYAKLEKKTDIPKDRHYIQMQPESQIDSKINLIKKDINIKDVKTWHFWGGEPLLTDTHLKFLREIEDYKSIKLVYTTNGSIFPDNETLEIWSKCREILILISVDGVNDRFHYCRWPLKWDKWTNNALRFKHETSNNITFCFNLCVMPMNIFYVNEVSEWIYKNFSTSENALNYIRSEGVINAANTPMSLREKVWKKYGDYHMVSKILSELPVEDTKNMLEHLEKWDKVRKLDWRKTFPEIVTDFN